MLRIVFLINAIVVMILPFCFTRLIHKISACVGTVGQEALHIFSEEEHILIQ